LRDRIDDDDDDDRFGGVCGTALLHIYTPEKLVLSSRSTASPRRQRAHDVSDWVHGGPRNAVGLARRPFFVGMDRWACKDRWRGKIAIRGPRYSVFICSFRMPNQCGNPIYLPEGRNK
jgi:hypothetical protein